MFRTLKSSDSTRTRLHQAHNTWFAQQSQSTHQGRNFLSYFHMILSPALFLAMILIHIYQLAQWPPLITDLKRNFLKTYQLIWWEQHNLITLNCFDSVVIWRAENTRKITITLLIPWRKAVVPSGGDDFIWLCLSVIFHQTIWQSKFLFCGGNLTDFQNSILF